MRFGVSLVLSWVWGMACFPTATAYGMSQTPIFMSLSLLGTPGKSWGSPSFLLPFLLIHWRLSGIGLLNLLSSNFSPWNIIILSLNSSKVDKTSFRVQDGCLLFSFPCLYWLNCPSQFAKQKKPNMQGATQRLHYPSQLLPLLSYRGWLLSISTASHCELTNLCQELLAHCRKYSLGRVCQRQDRPPTGALHKTTRLTAELLADYNTAKWQWRHKWGRQKVGYERQEVTMYLSI